MSTLEQVTCLSRVNSEQGMEKKTLRELIQVLGLIKHRLNHVW